MGEMPMHSKRSFDACVPKPEFGNEGNNKRFTAPRPDCEAGENFRNSFFRNRPPAKQCCVESPQLSVFGA